MFEMENSHDEKKIEKVKSYINLIRKNFECTICIDWFEVPVITNCRHSFCKKCIENFIGSKRSQNCPLCKKSINLRSLKNFESLEVLVNKAKELAAAFERDTMKCLPKSKTIQINEQPRKSFYSYFNEKESKLFSNKIFNCKKKVNQEKKDQTVEIQTSSISIQKRKRSNSEDKQGSNKKSKSNEQTSDELRPQEILASQELDFLPKTPRVRLSSHNNFNNNNNSRLNLNSAKVEQWLDKNGQDKENDKPSDLISNVNNKLKNDENQNQKSKKSRVEIRRISQLNNNPSLENAKEKEIAENEKKNDDETDKQQNKKLILNLYELSNENSSTKILDISEENNCNYNDKNVKKITDNEKEEEEGKDNEKEKNKENEARNGLEDKTNQYNDLSKIDNPLKFRASDISEQQQQQNSVSKSRLESSRITPKLFHTTSKLLSHFQLSSKKKQKQKETSDEDRTNEAPVETSLIFQTENQKRPFNIEKPNENDNNKKICEETQVLRIEDTICFDSTLLIAKERQPIKFFYKGNTSTTTTKKAKFKNTETKLKSAETNTDTKHFNDATTQTNAFDLIHFDKLEFKLLDLIFHKLNNELIDELAKEICDNRSIKQTEISTTTNTVGEKLIIENTLVFDAANNDENNESTVCNETILNKNESVISKSVHRNNFSELLEASRVFPDEKFSKRKLSSKQAKKMPSLEFLNNKETSNLGSELSEESEKNQIPSITLNLFADEDESKKKYLLENNLIIVDTPVKEDQDEEYLKDLKITLSKSANRMELLDSRILDFSKTNVENTILFQNETIIEKESFLNNEESLRPTEILENSRNENSMNPPEIPAATVSRKNIETNSFLLNSQNNSLNPMLAMSTTFNTSIAPGGFGCGGGNKIPNAADLLGVSFARDSLSFTAQSHSAFKNDSRKCKNNESEIFATDKNNCEFLAPSKPALSESLPKTKTQRKEEETQLLTDSELNVIDDICQDLYTTHNQTLDARSLSLSEWRRPKNLPQKSLLLASTKQEKKIEFVCSLLKPDVKEMVKRFAKVIKASVADEVTESTTHLIVESDKNLICGVTSKYLKAISRKIWIVSKLWILACVNRNELLDPSSYEIKGDGIFGVHNGPSMARLSRSDLFEAYEILFIGKFEEESISLSEMIELASRNGAKVVRKAKDFDEANLKHRMILFDEKLEKISAKNANFMLESARIHSVTSSWFLDSLACYQLRDLKTYALYDCD